MTDGNRNKNDKTGERLRESVDELLQKDQLDNDKAMAGDKPRHRDQADKAERLNDFHQD